MDWVWDDRKAAMNYAKHRVLFETAAAALDDPMQLSEHDLHPDGDRWRTYARLRNLLLFIVHTDPDESSGTPGRIISARLATLAERREYDRKTIIT